MLTVISIIIFCGLMAYAAYSDYTRYILSNNLCLTVLTLYFCFIGATYLDGTPLPLNYILISVGLAFAIFLILLLLFALNAMGGGDVKLIPIVALWAGPSLIYGFLMITAVVGGLLGIIIIVKKRFISQKSSQSSENVNFPVSKETKEKIPYGIAIACGGFFIAWELKVLMGLNI